MDDLVERLLALTAPADSPSAYRGCCSLDAGTPAATPAARKASKSASDLVAYLQGLKAPGKNEAAALKALRALRVELP